MTLQINLSVPFKKKKTKATTTIGIDIKAQRAISNYAKANNLMVKDIVTKLVEAFLKEVAHEQV